ncbi:MAG: TonB family protein [Bacteroidales bacterium]|mgnify:CR=1 FL=1|nr:TonB family protein [Bacteroidales bacterium]
MRQLIFLLLLMSATSLRAQFHFDFSPRRTQEEQRRETFTPPQFKGGESGIISYIKKKFEQPEEREERDGRIIVAVLVDAKGKVEQAQIVRSVSPTLDQEALRVCKRMKFKPAKQGNKKVKGRIDITFPIRRGRLSFNNLPTIDV